MKSTFGNPTDKKVPESKKYAHIISSINTGASAKKVQCVSSNTAARRRDEIFKRIRPATLVRMLQESEVHESIYALGDMSLDDRCTTASMASQVRTSGVPSYASVHSVAGSIVSVIDSDAATVDQSRNLVLLDLREPEEYDQCHLPLAVNYPAAKINRDQFVPELHQCKRDPTKLLVVYHMDEQATAGVATLLVQKGWDSVHALNGGFEEIAQSYPEVLEGEVPTRPDTGPTRATRSSRSRP